MAKAKVFSGTTGKVSRIFIKDASSTVGAGLTGLTSASSGLTIYYIREGGTAMTGVTLSAGTLGTWSSGGFVAVDAVHAPGLYEFGVPDAALLTGSTHVAFYAQGATNMVPYAWEVEMDKINYQDGVRAGLTALPNAAAGAAGGLPTGDASGNVGITSTAVAAIWNALLSGFSTSGSVGIKIAAFFTALGSDNRPKVSADAHASGEAVASVTANVNTNANATETAAAASAATAATQATAAATDAAAIRLKTVNIPAAPAAVSDIPSAATNATAAAAAILATPGHLLATDVSGNVGLSAAAIAAIEAALLDAANGVDIYTVRQTLAVTLAGFGGKASGATSGAGTPTFRNPGDTKNVITMTVDTNGNRSAVTLNP